MANRFTVSWLETIGRFPHGRAVACAPDEESSVGKRWGRIRVDDDVPHPVPVADQSEHEPGDREDRAARHGQQAGPGALSSVFHASPPILEETLG